MKVSASRNGLSPSSLHPVLRFSAGLGISAIFGEKSNRIVLLFPNRFNIDKWITVLCVLELLKKDFMVAEPLQLQFKPGDKLLFNNRCIVEFDSIEKNILWLKAADNRRATNSRFPLKLNKHLQLQPIDTDKRLSSVQLVCQEYFNTPECLIDSILNIYTAGNKSLFESNIIYVGLIGKTVEFINNTKINDIKLADLFLWCKLNAEGNMSIISSQKVQASPSGLIAPDLYSVLNYCNFEEDKSRAIIISDTSLCKNDPQSFTALLDSKIPIIVIADFNDLVNLESLVEYDFIIWQWNERNLKEITKQHKPQDNSIFEFFHRTLNNLCNQKIDTVICNYSELECIADELFLLEKKLQRENDKIKSLFSQLYQLHNALSGLIRFPSDEWLNNFRERVKKLEYQFNIQQLWISADAMAHLKKIISTFVKIVENPFPHENNKLDHLKKMLINHSISGRTIIIVPRDIDVEVTNNYWQTRLNNTPSALHYIEFMAASDFSLESLSFIPERIIVCSWLGHSVMYSIMHSYISDRITLLVYPKEASWFRGALYRWRQKKRFSTNFKEFSELMNFPEDSLGSDDDFLTEETILPVEMQEENIFEFELRINQYRYAGYKASQSSTDDIENAKLVIFNNDFIAFFTKTHKSIVVTDLVKESNSKLEINKLTFNNLKVGDYILFYESDKDLIREFADKGLAKSGKSNLRDIAGIWKKALYSKLKSFNYNKNRLVSHLKLMGCKRHPQTIENWLHDGDIIGPGIITDLDVIAKATQDKELENNMDTVKKAISEVRGAHHQASSFLTQQLIAKLPFTIIKGNYLTPQLTLDIHDFGRVFILRIEEIGSEWIDIEKSNTNRLLREGIN